MRKRSHFSVSCSLLLTLALVLCGCLGFVKDAAAAVQAEETAAAEAEDELPEEREIMEYGPFRITAPEAYTVFSEMEDMGVWMLVSAAENAKEQMLEVRADPYIYVEAVPADLATAINLLEKAAPKGQEALEDEKEQLIPEYLQVNGIDTLILRKTAVENEEAYIHEASMYLKSYVLRFCNLEESSQDEAILSMLESVTVEEGELPYFAYSTTPEMLEKKGLAAEPFCYKGLSMHLPENAVLSMEAEGRVSYMTADGSLVISFHSGSMTDYSSAAIWPTSRESLERAFQNSGSENFESLESYRSSLINSALKAVLFQYKLKLEGTSYLATTYCFRLPDPGHVLNVNFIVLNDDGEALRLACEDTMRPDFSPLMKKKEAKEGEADYAALGLSDEAVEFEGISLHMPLALSDTGEDHPVYFGPGYLDSIQVIKKEAADFDAQTREDFEKSHYFSMMGTPTVHKAYEKYEYDGFGVIMITFSEDTPHNKVKQLGREQEDMYWIQVYFPDRLVSVHATDATGQHTEEILAALKTVCVLDGEEIIPLPAPEN